MDNQTKIAAIKELVKATEDLFAVPNKHVDMNNTDMCAMAHCKLDAIYGDDDGEFAKYRHNLLSLNQNYPKPKGMAGKLEFAKRALVFINAIPTL